MDTPWSWKASDFWDGNDGLWNSFIVQVGTPPQDFRVLPSILEQAAWIPHPQGCTPDDPIDCPYDRGVLPFQGNNNTGFQANESSSWNLIGLYRLSWYGELMGYSGNGQFGFDNVVLSNKSDALELPHQVVAAIADKSFYLGQFGLGPKPSNFTTFNDDGRPSIDTVDRHWRHVLRYARSSSSHIRTAPRTLRPCSVIAWSSGHSRQEMS